MRGSKLRKRETVQAFDQLEGSILGFESLFIFGFAEEKRSASHAMHVLESGILMCVDEVYNSCDFAIQNGPDFGRTP